MGEFICQVDFVVLEAKKVLDFTKQILISLGHPFSYTLNSLINCRNRMTRLFVCNMTLELNILYL